MSVAVGAIVPLVSAALAGFVAWIVAQRQGRTARENWLLDKRHEAYVAVVQAAAAIWGVRDWTEVRAELADSEKLRALLSVLHKLDVVAPVAVRTVSGDAYQRLSRLDSSDHTALRGLSQVLDRLVVLLREDLVPEHMR